MKEYYNEEQLLEQKVKDLVNVKFLADLTTQELKELAKELEYHDYLTGYEIIKQGKKYESLYILTHGRVEAIVEKEGHESLQMSTYGPGAAIGEISLLTGKPAGTTIRCMQACEFLVLDSQSFALMLVRWPKLYQRFIEKLSQRLNQTNNDLWEAKYKEFLRSAMQLTAYEERFYGIWGGKGTRLRIEAKIEELSQSDKNLLLVGESGTGRQMMAWFIHKKRFGKTAPFVVIDGQHFDKQWGDSVNALLSIMGRGTLYIKKLNLISPKAQYNLANYLNSGEHESFIVGAVQNEPDRLDPKLVPEFMNCFNQKFHIPSLRERKRDIPAIAQGVIDYQAQKQNRKAPVLDQEATRVLLSHNYRQGNTTELIQIVERAFSLAENDLIRVEHIFFGPTARKIGRTFNLLDWKPLYEILRKGRFVNGLRGITSVGFILMLFILLLGQDNKVASGMFAMVWGLWWPTLVIISPFLGRIWCTVCPFAYIMEKVQNLIHFNRPVPEFVKKYDYILITFLFLLIFWIEVVTGMRNNPYSTVILLVIITLAAIVVGVIFTRHTWCKHLCPIGGLVGTASIGSLMEVRADPTVCLNKCTTFDCYVGNDSVPGCPMFQHLPYLDNSLACKMCFNCVQNCPNGSVQLNLRVPAREVWNLVRVNQGFSIFIGASLAILFPLNIFEAFHEVWGQEQWRLWFTITYWGSAFAGGLLTYLLVRPNQTKAASKRVKLVFALIPLLLAGHIMYQLNFIPGADSFLLGLGWRTSGDLIKSFYLPIYSVGQGMALLIGLALTSFTILMIYLTYKSKINPSRHKAEG